MENVGDGYAMNRIYDSASWGSNGGANVGNGILFGQNQQINRDVLMGTCDTQKATLAITDTIHQGNANVMLNEQMRINALEMNNNTRFIQLDNKMDTLSRDYLHGRIDDLQTAKIIDNQTINRLQQDVNNFCCPKPAAVYQPFTCANMPS